MTRISSLPNLLARSGGGPQPAPFPTHTPCIRAFASELSPVVCPHILARNHPARAEEPFAFNTPVAEQMLRHAHRPQTRVRPPACRSCARGRALRHHDRQRRSSAFVGIGAVKA